MFSSFARAVILVFVFTAHLINQAESEVYIDGSKALKRAAAPGGVAYANFAVHKFRYLNLAPLVSASVTEPRECGKRCVDHPSCFSTNLAAFRDQDGKVICELLPSDKYNNSNKFIGHQTFHHLSIKTPCYSNPCMNQATCVPKYEDHAYLCVCDLGYSGKHCEIAPVYSCNEILSKTDGEYWIKPEKSGNPLKVFCDMTTDGGGWLLVSNVVIDESSISPQLSLETTYRGISNYNNNKTFLTTSAMHELRTHLPFTELRFYCSKQQGPRIFHVTTATNSIGEAVVEYFSGQTDVQPVACGSFVTMENDNSRLAGQCHLWGKENGVLRVGKWGHGEDQDRLFRFTVFNHANYYWLFLPDGSKVRCDDLSNAVSSGDFWKVFVR